MKAAGMRTVAATFAALAVAVTGVVAGAASPANAAASIIFVSDTTPADNAAIVVAGFVGTPGHQVSIAECNVTADPVTARACNRTATNRFAIVTSDTTFGFWGTTITVDNAFTNATFSGLPAIPGTTTCASVAGSNGTCAIQAQEYQPGFIPVGGPATTNLSF